MNCNMQTNKTFIYTSESLGGSFYQMTNLMDGPLKANGSERSANVADCRAEYCENGFDAVIFSALWRMICKFTYRF